MGAVGFRIRRSIRLGPWLRLNLSGGGVSLTAGMPGANVNLSRRGVKATVGLPGSGISYSSWIGRGAIESAGAATIARPGDSPRSMVTHVSAQFDQRASGCYQDLVAGLETLDPWIPLPDEFDWRAAVPPRLATQSDLRGVAAGTERLIDPRFGALGISQRNAARLMEVLRGDEAAIHEAVRTAIAGLQIPFDLAVSFGVKGGGQEIVMVVALPLDAWVPRVPAVVGPPKQAVRLGLAVGLGMAEVVAALCVAPGVGSVRLGVLGLQPDAGEGALLADLVVDRPSAVFLVQGNAPIRRALLRMLGAVAVVETGELHALGMPAWIRDVLGAGPEV